MSKRKLLLADDSVTVQKVVNLAFESEDIEVITANDGMSAFERIVEFSPDLVMADINLSGADGYEICERIKRDDETKHIPVLLLVGSFVPFSEEKAERVGADGFLKKPFQSIGLLINKVTDLLDANKESDNDSSEVDFNNADTQPMPVYNSSESTDAENHYSESDELGESGMDDEMIETAYGTDYSFVDETSKYETTSNFEIVTEDSEKTQTMSYTDVEDLDLDKRNEETAEESSYELADEPDELPSASAYDFNDETKDQTYENIEDNLEDKPNTYSDYSDYSQTKAAETESFPTPEAASALDLDDFELLELPPLNNTNQPFADNYSSFRESAETTAETNISPAQDDHSNYAEMPTEEYKDSSKMSANIKESSEIKAAESTEDHYSPISDLDMTQKDFGVEEDKKLSEDETGESTQQHFDEEEKNREIASQTQALISQETRQISQTSDNKVVVHYLPPEVIDEIAERVVEKLAEKLRR